MAGTAGSKHGIVNDGVPLRSDLKKPFTGPKASDSKKRRKNLRRNVRSKRAAKNKIRKNLFIQIPTGEDFELLCEDLLRSKGAIIESHPSRGPDRGLDILAIHTFDDDLGFRYENRIAVECKHFAQSGKSVKESDLGKIIERTISHNCNHYLLITSTIPSASVAHQLQGITANPSIPIIAHCWAKNDLEKLLSEFPKLKEQYFS